MDRGNTSKLLAQCPLCQTVYQEAEVRLLSERGASSLFHCTCHACGYAILTMILEIQGSVSSIGLVTDLEIKDAVRFKEFAVISADDCILAHRVMTDESLAFCSELLKRA